MDLLEVKNISKTYGTGEATVHALKDAPFSVPKGEFVAVVGESGSGKSTLLNMIGALDTPTSGKVFIDSKDIFSMKETQPDGIPPTEYRFHFPELQPDPGADGGTEYHFPGAAGLSEAKQKVSGRTADGAGPERTAQSSAQPAFRAVSSSVWR